MLTMCDQHEFFFEFDKAYNHQLIEKFEASPEHQLTENVAPAERDVYAVYYKGQLVYAGKALRHASIVASPNITGRSCPARILT